MIDKNEIARLYEEGKTTREVAAALGCGKTSVGSVIKSRGLSRSKKITYRTKLRNANRCAEPSEWFKDYLDGLLISDGSMRVPKGENQLSTSYIQTSVDKDWLIQIKKVFLDHGIEGSIGEDFRSGRRPAWVFWTLSYHDLLGTRNRWYQIGGKNVPCDLNMSSKEFLSNWVYGDGTLLSGSTLRFCTDSFSEAEVDMLVVGLNDAIKINSKKMYFGQTKHGNDKWRIALCVRDGLDDFFRYLGKTPLACFEHKWRKT